jgi:formylglycine-generating enzyme required for sulfatase activity
VPSRLAALGFVARHSGAVASILPPLCAVPAGTLQMGSDKKRRDPQAEYDERPQHPVALGAFQIGRYPVTVAEYACFVAAGQREPGGWEEQLQRLDLPVELVSWRDVTAYAAWLAQLTGQFWRLPTGAEWEWAARGADGRIYPWGDQWDPLRANTSESRMRGMDMTPVGAYAGWDDDSPWGAHDMAGNVWEWTSSAYEPYPNDDRVGSQRVDSNEKRVLRGGSCWDKARFARTAFRLYWVPDLIDLSTGFRLACESSDAEPPTQAPADGRNHPSSDIADTRRDT